ncbi:MAG: OmpA family protein [Azoarcus sp.]|jgi:outer membrane protein OmpA-like peptidoglycan-associated protein|nr:OmpA family protein [Azoarcus sp.]
MMSIAIRPALTRMWAMLFCAGLLAAGCKSLGLSDEQITALKDAGFHKEEEGWELDFEGLLLFESNASELTPHSRETIVRTVKLLKDIGIGQVRVEGYADNTGNKAHNEKLSLARAEAVAQEIERAGLPRSNITVKGFGAANPVGNNKTREGRAQNRRVAIIIQVDDL